jgi:hypothetical protein
VLKSLTMTVSRPFSFQYVYARISSIAFASE